MTEDDLAGRAELSPWVYPLDPVDWVADEQGHAGVSDLLRAIMLIPIGCLFVCLGLDIDTAMAPWQLAYGLVGLGAFLIGVAF